MTWDTKAMLAFLVLLLVIGFYALVVYMPPSTQYGLGIGVGMVLARIARWEEAHGNL